MLKDKINKYHLSLAGEYRVASELLKRKLNATVTFGNAKSADVVAYGPNRKAIIVEVKTSQQENFVTSFYNKYATAEQEEHPDFWILLQVKVDTNIEYSERFFILSHFELANIQAKRNRAYRLKHGDITENQQLTWGDHYRLTTEAHGVDNVLMTDVLEYVDKWDKIIQACNNL